MAHGHIQLRAKVLVALSLWETEPPDTKEGIANELQYNGCHNYTTLYNYVLLYYYIMSYVS